MGESGLDARVWVTLVGIFVVFFLLPGLYLEWDRRKSLRETHGDSGRDRDRLTAKSGT